MLFVIQAGILQRYSEWVIVLPTTKLGSCDVCWSCFKSDTLKEFKAILIDQLFCNQCHKDTAQQESEIQHL